jgi:predicted NACHT family NTPase
VRERRIPGLEAVEKHRRLMVLGKPGAGKTTFLKYLAMQCITGGYAADKVPFFVTLKVLPRRTIGPVWWIICRGRSA